MSWDSLTMYSQGLDFFTGVVESVPDAGWASPSPCAGWTARDVLGHVGTATAMGAAILAGEPVEVTRIEPPGDAVTGEPGRWWAQLAATARTAAAAVDDLERVVESPMGPRTVAEGLSFPAVDLFLHGWDLAAATGTAVELPPEAIAFTVEMFREVPEDVARGPGVFGPPLPVGPEATATARLIAFTGRDPEHG
ncbi:hypothetical protein GOHSU_20_00130 [Gordonia hirsuta DSM 44140 = NBRC 16056]|uniref:Mycothiol-dependent maleylpyruvate isomerase metal-binding domain-containing protein n=1 Tax=Gordonia hirsuta DSM 44140 = NBRC 16056 TaxID=1121927 RepID=L7L9S8_9ACTN|nr:TIGR03086 family metal-binding protein [Gordonia hirsuta]GAC57476.1 hypothetical protein GOHSU_20_00130 [Gordonia hirsuta DSM 44140 = NBRC 16056]